MLKEFPPEDFWDPLKSYRIRDFLILFKDFVGIKLKI
jgi:hypothetical protein